MNVQPTLARNLLLAWSLIAFLSACTSSPEIKTCDGSAQSNDQCQPSSALGDAEINDLFESRSWVSNSELKANDLDPVRIGSEADIPVNRAQAKLIGSSYEAARNSLAAKLWMIENAEHTIDVAYYIYRNDLVGYALLGALCEAVQRGVDIRIIIDSAGSMTTPKSSFTALSVCEENAGYMRNSKGETTTRRARVQVVVFNALTKLSSSPNRRSHDKLLVTDGEFTDKAYIMTGGRNISLDYYGLTASGEVDPYSYRDAEIVLRPLRDENQYDLGEISSGYFTLLFLYRGNRFMRAVNTDTARDIYYREQAKSLDALETVRSMPIMKEHLANMGVYMTNGFVDTESLLAHELANLDNRRVTSQAVENYKLNPNSIINILGRISDASNSDDVSRLVSPYLFLARYLDDEGNVLLDEAEEIKAWLAENPKAKVEIITNSVLTSDNFSAQSIIDMSTAPRLLLEPDLREAWLNLKTIDELDSELVNSDAWKQQVGNSRLRIYETGKLDSNYFADDGVQYGKLHAKYWQKEQFSFVGTSNFDYRSRLFNNEMGYFMSSETLAEQLIADFEALKSTSLLWGSREWLELRHKLAEKDGMKSMTTRQQRPVYKTLKATGLHWLF